MPLMKPVPDNIVENPGGQHFLATGHNVLVALEGARDLQNGTSGLTGEETQFKKPDTLKTLRAAETGQYEAGLSRSTSPRLAIRPVQTARVKPDSRVHSLQG
ncbi:hypothetical protein DZD18_09600 [Rhodobacteraceae bacterium W635]|uniref:hypothetical protein n=1 Tax=Nioella halotolerans TaxID=2303578 RepID=UPI000E3D24B7|nr:hypothetical protein DZD18_09600 [Rhodobacteraceae bacterium W635]